MCNGLKSLAAAQINHWSLLKFSPCAPIDAPGHMKCALSKQNTPPQNTNHPPSAEEEEANTRSTARSTSKKAAAFASCFAAACDAASSRPPSTTRQPASDADAAAAARPRAEARRVEGRDPEPRGPRADERPPLRREAADERDVRVAAHDGPALADGAEVAVRAGDVVRRRPDLVEIPVFVTACSMAFSQLTG